MKILNNFIKQYIKDKNISIYAGNDKVLDLPLASQYLRQEYEGFSCFIKSGQEFSDKDEIRIIDSVADLYRAGWRVVSREIADKRHNPYQRVGYYLERIYKDAKLMSKWPKPNMYVEYSPYYKKIRVRGPNTGPMNVGPWIDLFEKRVEKQVIYTPSDYTESSSEILERLKKKLSFNILEERKVEIKEIPMMFLESGELLCIKKDEDMPTMGFVGKKGAGKTYGAHSTVDRIRWQWEDNMLVTNDSLNQTFTWGMPNQAESAKMILKKIGQKPMALPCVHLWPQTGTLKNAFMEENGTAVRTSISFKEMVKAYSYFLKGKEEWILGKSEKYFKNIQGDISECKSLSDVEETLYNNFGQEKSLKPTINKIMSCMQDIWESNFLDISNRIPSNWMFNFDNEQFFDSPYMGLAKMGIVPIIVTSNLKNQHYYPQYKRLIYDKIFNLQLESKKRKRTWLFVDEIGNIYKRGQTKTVAADSLTRCVTEGRQPQLGVIYTIQNYSKLDEEIRNNTSYLFSLVYSSQEEINAISADFDLPKNLKDTLKRLKPKEMMAMSNDKKFVIYTPDGNRYEQSGAFKGIGVPALSEHMRPSAIKYLFGITDEDETAEEEEENE